ncbi:MAG: hypothetical protein ACOYMV_13630 [Verrucomicrobiia bacterium]
MSSYTPRFTIEKADLADALRGLRKLVLTKSTLPVLGHVRVSHQEGRRTLVGTDLDAVATYAIPAETPASPLGAMLLANRWQHEACEFLVPLNELMAASTRCDRGGTVTLEPLPKSTVRITVPLGGVPTPVTALSLPLDEFPSMKTGLDAAPECEIPPSHFLRAMECASTDETRFVLNGVCLWVGPKTKKNAAHAIVGTDGRTMYAGNSLHFPWKHDTIIPKGDLFALLPADAPWRVRSVFTAADEKKKISESGFWRIATGRWSVEGKCVYGVFPNWRQVIPTDHPVGIELTAEALATLCAHVPKLPTQFDGDRVRTASVDVEVTADSLIASVGEARVTVPAVVKFHRGAPPLLTKFNREYFLRAPTFGLRSWGMDTEGPLAATSLDQTFVAMPLRRAEPPAVAPTTTKQPVMVPVTVATPATP